MNENSFIYLRVNKDDKEKIKQAAKAFNYHTMSSFIRKVILDYVDSNERTKNNEE